MSSHYNEIKDHATLGFIVPESKKLSGIQRLLSKCEAGGVWLFDYSCHSLQAFVLHSYDFFFFISWLSVKVLYES